MSSAASSSRTANTACLKARLSTLSRKSDISLSVAKEGRAERPIARSGGDYRIAPLAAEPAAERADADAIIRGCTTVRIAGTSPTAEPQPRHRSQATTPASRGREKVHRWFSVREIHKGSIMDTSAAELKRAASAPPRTTSGAELERRRNRHPLPPGRRRRVRLRLSGRRGAQHLRRALQAGKGQARAGAPRAGRGARGRRLFALVDKVGVALVTSGPGVTNAVTGIATAYMDSIPMVVLTGQVPTHAIGQDAFQECDTVGITRPCVKHNFLVKDVKRPRAHDQEGVLPRRAPAGPGPVLVDIPKDVTQATTRVQLSEDGVAALVQPGDQGPRRADQEGGAAAARGEAADGLRRRRRDPEQRVGRS